MINVETNINTVPFYDSLDSLYRNERYYEDIHHIFQSAKYIPRFQLQFNFKANGVVATCKLFDINNVEKYSFDIDEGIITWNQLPNELTKTLVSSNGELLTNEIAEGYYRIEVYYDTQTKYSEYFYAISDTSKLVRLSYYSDKNIAIGDNFIYPDYAPEISDDDYTHVFNAYFNTDIGKPQYPFENVMSSFGGVDYPLHIISKKEFRFFIVIIESQMDALRIASASDYIQASQNNKPYNISNIEFGEVEWDDTGKGVVEVKFTVAGTINASGNAPTTRGSFNNDFNNDLE